jgi:4-hydroxy-4-methyl-2-oxoglutarate aldolase
MTDAIAELAALGSATVYEAGGRRGYVDLDLIQILAGSRVAGPARTVKCGQDDNLMVHAAMAQVQTGEVLVLTMPAPRPVGIVGDLIDAAVRDIDTLAELGLPIWARWVRVKGATKDIPGTIGEPVQVGGAIIRQGDIVVMDADGAAVVEAERVDDVLEASRRREDKERVKRIKLQAGELSYDLDGLRERVEGA